MANKGRSKKDFFGNGYTHFDSNGKKIGRSEKNIFGSGYTNYDANGKKVGRTEKNFFGGGYTTYDNKGNKVGRSDPQLFGTGYNHNSGGCYVATCVYGSYDCPEVWTLRSSALLHLMKKTEKPVMTLNSDITALNMIMKLRLPTVQF